MKRRYKFLVIILVFLLMIFMLYVFSIDSKRSVDNEINTNIDETDLTETFSLGGLTNGIENSQLIEIARQYILTEPQLFLNNDKFVDWDNYSEIGSDFSKVTTQWIVSQKSTVRYVESGKYPAPYDDLNDKYIVTWFFVPGCEENSGSNDKPNWFDDKGHNCAGGYEIRVLIKSDLTVDHTKLDAID